MKCLAANYIMQHCQGTNILKISTRPAYYKVHSDRPPFTLTSIHLDLHSPWPPSPWPLFTLTSIQIDLHSPWPPFTLTTIDIDPHSPWPPSPWPLFTLTSIHIDLYLYWPIFTCVARTIILVNNLYPRLEVCVSIYIMPAKQWLWKGLV